MGDLINMEKTEDKLGDDFKDFMEKEYDCSFVDCTPKEEKKEMEKLKEGEAEMKQLMKKMKSDNRNNMDVAYNELCEILKPINVTKLTRLEKTRFIDNNGFDKAWEQIKKIIVTHRWLCANYETKFALHESKDDNNVAGVKDE